MTALTIGGKPVEINGLVWQVLDSAPLPTGGVDITQRTYTEDNPRPVRPCEFCGHPVPDEESAHTKLKEANAWRNSTKTWQQPAPSTEPR